MHNYASTSHVQTAASDTRELTQGLRHSHLRRPREYHAESHRALLRHTDILTGHPRPSPCLFLYSHLHTCVHADHTGWLCTVAMLTHPGRGPGKGKPGLRGGWGNGSGPRHPPVFGASLHRVLIVSEPQFPYQQILVWGDVSGFGVPCCVGMDNSEWGLLRPAEERRASDQGILRQMFPSWCLFTDRETEAWRRIAQGYTGIGRAGGIQELLPSRLGLHLDRELVRGRLPACVSRWQIAAPGR